MSQCIHVFKKQIVIYIIDWFPVFQDEATLSEAIGICESAIGNADKVLVPISGKKSKKRWQFE